MSMFYHHNIYTYICRHAGIYLYVLYIYIWVGVRTCIAILWGDVHPFATYFAVQEGTTVLTPNHNNMHNRCMYIYIYIICSYT